jgi:hypothetical protein
MHDLPVGLIDDIHAPRTVVQAEEALIQPVITERPRNSRRDFGSYAVGFGGVGRQVR